MRQLDELQQRFNNLSQRDQNLTIAMAIILVITLFYTAIWEPLHLNLKNQQAIQITQNEIISWMHGAAAEVRSLKSSGRKAGKKLNANSPVSIVAEQSATTSGLKKQISKIESSGKNAAQIKIDNASFDQMLIWIDALKIRYGMSVSSAKIERTEKSGIINARLTLNRS